MAAPNALLNALRIPGQIVIHYQRRKLGVDTLGTYLGGNHASPEDKAKAKYTDGVLEHKLPKKRWDHS